MDYDRIDCTHINSEIKIQTSSCRPGGRPKLVKKNTYCRSSAVHPPTALNPPSCGPRIAKLRLVQPSVQWHNQVKTWGVVCLYFLTGCLIVLLSVNSKPSLGRFERIRAVVSMPLVQFRCTVRWVQCQMMQAHLQSFAMVVSVLYSPSPHPATSSQALILEYS